MKIDVLINFHVIDGQQLVITGSIPELGNWNPELSPKMQYLQDGDWIYSLDLPGESVAFEYKFCLLERGQVRWEKDENRRFSVTLSAKKKIITVSDIEFQALEHPWRGAGVAIPVFSLRSGKSFGIGDFGDLQLLVDWAAETNQKIIQLLPINDTTLTHTWQDSYPYNAISIYALHPLYINLAAMGEIKNAKKRAFYAAKQQELNALPVVDYEAVEALKWAYFKDVFKQETKKQPRSKEAKTFFETNQEWLEPYAEFCCERDKIKVPELYYFVQFHADKQMKAASEYAHNKGIKLKGDVPIGISRESVDAKTEPNYFKMNFQVGAPPDAFAADGQNWGFPAYNWKTLDADGYGWWKDRFCKMADYFDAYRIDHILGFFRIWQIPIRYKDGLNGYFSPALPLTIAEIEHSGLEWHTVKDLFIEDEEQKKKYHPRITAFDLPAFHSLSEHEKQTFTHLHHDYFYFRHNEFWKHEALKKLTPLVNATSMLACGEDLGMIPQSVPEVMKKLQILSLEIERMPKSWDYEFTNLPNIPYLSVCTTSTHDMTTLRAWWMEDREKTQRYYNNVLRKEGGAPEECTSEIAEQIIRNHAHSPAMLAIFPLQDWLAMDEKLRHPDTDAERINIPANPRHYWRYRMHLSLEELLQAKELNTKINEIIEQAGR
jgi:4-alpha-glucanotransferase